MAASQGAATVTGPGSPFVRKAKPADAPAMKPSAGEKLFASCCTKGLKKGLFPTRYRLILSRVKVPWLLFLGVLAGVCAVVF